MMHNKQKKKNETFMPEFRQAYLLRDEIHFSRRAEFIY